MASPTQNKRFYGAITVSERGQIVIPVDARRDFDIQVGDKLLVLGDLEEGIALIKASTLLNKNPLFFRALQDDLPKESSPKTSDSSKE